MSRRARMRSASSARESSAGSPVSQPALKMITTVRRATHAEAKLGEIGMRAHRPAQIDARPMASRPPAPRRAGGELARDARRDPLDLLQLLVGEVAEILPRERRDVARGPRFFRVVVV